MCVCVFWTLTSFCFCFRFLANDADVYGSALVPERLFCVPVQRERVCVMDTCITCSFITPRLPFTVELWRACLCTRFATEKNDWADKFVGRLQLFSLLFGLFWCSVFIYGDVGGVYMFSARFNSCQWCAKQFHATFSVSCNCNFSVCFDDSARGS